MVRSVLKKRSFHEEERSPPRPYDGPKASVIVYEKDFLSGLTAIWIINSELWGDLRCEKNQYNAILCLTHVSDGSVVATLKLLSPMIGNW